MTFHVLTARTPVEPGGGGRILLQLTCAGSPDFPVTLEMEPDLAVEMGSRLVAVGEHLQKLLAKQDADLPIEPGPVVFRVEFPAPPPVIELPPPT